jgi:iron complex outermembrane receptor protein
VGQAASSVPVATQPAASQPSPAPPKSDQLEDIELLQMDVPIVVTAARHEQKITSVPYAMSVITAEDIRCAGARSIPDALRLVPGVDVADLGYGNAAVSPRGFHGFLARQVLVLVDGRQIFDSHFGGTSWGSWPFLLEDIERIEVIRGPAGVTWGANAVNGVINVITKDPKDQTGVTLRGGGGSDGSHREYAGWGFADQKVRFRASGEYEGSPGFTRGGTPLLRPDDDYRAARGSLHLIAEPTPRDTVTLSGGSGVLGSGFSRSPLGGITGGRRDESQASYLLARWAHQVEKDNTLEWAAYVNDFFVSPGQRAIDYRYQQLALQFSHTFKPADQHTLTWGVDTRADLLDATNSDPFLLKHGYLTSGIFGLYAQDEWNFAPRWALNLGGRIDYDTYGGFQPSGRAALSYQLTKQSQVYGAVARAFQMPPLGLRHLDLPLLDGLARATSHMDLRSQGLLAYELGYRTRLFDRLDLNFDVFWNEHSDVTTLSPRLGPPGLIRMDEYNRASASMYGAELEWKYALTKELAFLGNYTYQQLGWDSVARIQEKDMISPPSHKFMLGARYSPLSDLHLSTHAYWVDAVDAPNPWNPFVSKQIDPYWRLDLRAEYEFWNKRASVAVGVRNLLAAHHFEGATLFLNDAEVPRVIYAEFRLAIK